MEKRLAIFDLDGTLFDTKDANYWAYKEALESYGYTIEYDYYRDYCNGRYFKDFLPQITTSDEKILLSIHALKKRIYSKYLCKIRPNWNLLCLVRTMRPTFFTAIVTSASKTNCLELLEYFHVSDCFDKVFTHEDILQKKPSPEGFLQAMNYFNVNTDHTIIFEDSDVGLEAAMQSGADYYVVTGYN